MRDRFLGFAGCCLTLVSITVSAQNTFPTTGNVGIGTTSPQSALTLTGGYLDITAGSGQQSYNEGIRIHPAPDGCSAFMLNAIAGTSGTGASEWSMYSCSGQESGALNFYNSGNEVITALSNGNVGIGTTNPGAKLEVDGNVKLTSGSGSSITFPDGSVQTTAWTSGAASSVVGGATPGATTAGLMLNQTYVSNTGGATHGHSYKIASLMASSGGSYDHLHVLATVNNNWFSNQNSYIDAEFSNRGGFLYQYSVRGAQVTSAADLVAYNNGTTIDIYLSVPNLNAFTTVSYTILENQQETVYTSPVDTGASFTGTLVFDAASSTYPASTYIDESNNFTLAGNVKLTAGSGASMTYQDGSVQTVAWNGVLGGGDYAESVDVSGDRAQYEPGDVLVIDPSAEGKFLRSSQPYSTAVMGIYSTNPGVVGRRQTTDKSHMKAEVPMAMVGVVPTKVNTEGGAIKPGDLLVTSSTPGYAMRGSDRSQLTGAIIGKALGHLDAGKGVIEVAVSIQ